MAPSIRGSAFSVSKGDIVKVCNYIINQPEHHRMKSYMEEYEAFIKFYQKTLKLKEGNKSLSIWEYGPKKNN